MERDFDASVSRLRRISDIDTDLARLEGLLSKLKYFIFIGTARRAPDGNMRPPNDIGSTPAQFGSVHLVLTAQDLRDFGKLQKEMHTIGGRVSVGVAELLIGLDDARYFVNSDGMYALQKFREDMNSALKSKTFGEALSRADNIIESGRTAMQQVRRAVGG